MSPSSIRLTAALAATLFCGALGACDIIPSPGHQSAAARKAAEHRELEEAISHKTERDKAEHAADPVLDADKQHDKAIDDAGG
jgi:hypothetical protein